MLYEQQCKERFEKEKSALEKDFSNQLRKELDAQKTQHEKEVADLKARIEKLQGDLKSRSRQYNYVSDDENDQSRGRGAKGKQAQKPVKRPYNRQEKPAKPAEDLVSSKKA